MSDTAQFMDRVEKVDCGCWLFTGGKTSKGYGAFYVDGKQILAHRYAWQTYNGEIPANKFICHICDVRLCVNPEHLFLGDAQDNVDDMWSKGRAKPHSKLDQESVEAIKEHITFGEKNDRQIAEMFGISRGRIWQIRSILT